MSFSRALCLLPPLLQLKFCFHERGGAAQTLAVVVGAAAAAADGHTEAWAGRAKRGRAFEPRDGALG